MSGHVARIHILVAHYHTMQCRPVNGDTNRTFKPVLSIWLQHTPGVSADRLQHSTVPLRRATDALPRPTVPGAGVALQQGAARQRTDAAGRPAR